MKFLSSLPRRWVVLGAVVVVLLVAAIVTGTVLNSLDTTSASSKNGARGAAGSSATPGGSDAAPAPGLSPAPEPTSTTTRTTTEVKAGGGSTGGGLPLSSAAPSLFTGPAPKSASANGSLVKGFPSIISVASGSKISSSSVSSSSGIIQATLVARTTQSPTDVLAFYTASFGKLGVAPTPVAAATGSKAYSYARGVNSVTVTVTEAPGGSRYSVFAVLHATV